MCALSKSCCVTWCNASLRFPCSSFKITGMLVDNNLCSRMIFHCFLYFFIITRVVFKRYYLNVVFQCARCSDWRFLVNQWIFTLFISHNSLLMPISGKWICALTAFKHRNIWYSSLVVSQRLIIVEIKSIRMFLFSVPSRSSFIY